MNSYESLYEKTALTGVYDLNKSSAVCAELEAYAAVLDTVCAELEEMYRENFTATSQTYGLSRREEIVLGIVSYNFLPERRRSILAKKYLLTENDFTLGALEELLSSYGVQFGITENPQQQLIIVDAELDGMSETMKNAFAKSILDFLPAHLEGEVVYSGKRWSEIDADDRTFTQYDADDYTWSQIDK